jgi:hypothetical protein
MANEVVQENKKNKTKNIIPFWQVFSRKKELFSLTCKKKSFV